MHGPKPRSHAIKLQKKVRRLGLKIALSARTAEGKVLVNLPNLHMLQCVRFWLTTILYFQNCYRKINCYIKAWFNSVS
jgi:hypothetical protein